jgi:hypothetical protein
MLTAVCLRALALVVLLITVGTAVADICDDYARVIDAHIAMLRTIEKRTNTVSDSKQAVDVINQYVDEMIYWRRQMAPLDRAVFEMDQGKTRKNHAKLEATSSSRVRKLLSRRYASA